MDTKRCKKCPRCGLVKPASEFGRAISRIGGLTYACLECGREWQRQYYKAHREEVKAYIRQWQKEHPEKCKDYRAKFDNSEYQQNYYRSHKEEHFERQQRRRALLVGGAVADFDVREWVEQQSTPWLCYLCGRKIKKDEGYHIDHIIPLSRGGAHAPWNLAIVHAKCNLQKHDKTPTEFAPERFPMESLFL